MIRRPATPREAPPAHAIPCSGCGRTLGLLRSSGSYMIPNQVMVRPGGELVTECQLCHEQTVLPYRRAS